MDDWLIGFGIWYGIILAVVMLAVHIIGVLASVWHPSIPWILFPSVLLAGCIWLKRSRANRVYVEVVVPPVVLIDDLAVKPPAV